MSESTETSAEPNDSNELSLVRSLLSRCKSAVTHQRDLERITGEHFNLFEILRIGHYEVSTHSRIIGDLLNPNGKHGQGSVFFEHFKEILKSSSLRLGVDDAVRLADECLAHLERFDPDTVDVRLEVSLGDRTDTHGGRIDILLTDKIGSQIAIENKIHGAEQPNWVERYCNGISTGAPLIYLTLHGERPNVDFSKSTGRLGCLSYRDDIVQWLEKCRKDVATVPLVRESLTQYLNLILSLTNQNSSSRMNDKIAEVVTDSFENFDAYIALKGAESSIVGLVVSKFADKIASVIPSDFPMVRKPTGSANTKEAFVFQTEDLKMYQLEAVISFDQVNYGKCYFGFQTTDKSLENLLPPNVRNAITKNFSNTFQKKCKSSGIWPAWIEWDECFYWDLRLAKSITFSRDGFKESFENLVSQMRLVSIAFAQDMRADRNSLVDPKTCEVSHLPLLVFDVEERANVPDGPSV